MTLFSKEKTSKNIAEAEKVSNKANAYKKFSEATASRHGIPAKISKANFAKAVDEITTYIFNNRHNNVELARELVLLEANLSEHQFIDDIDASLRDVLSQLRTIIISVIASIVSIKFFTNYEIKSHVIVVTASLLLVLYFVLSYACTHTKGQTLKIFDTKFKKAIAITISSIIESEENERNAIKQEQIKTMICTNIALLQNT